MPCCRRRFSPAHRRSSATWRPPPATSCSARAACTSATPPCPATSASPEPAARRSPAQPHARHPRHERTLHRDQPLGHVRGDGGIGSDDPCAGTQGCARDRRSATFIFCPADTPHRETVLEPGDLITHVTLPPPVAGSRQVYLKLRDRASYEFALASAAVVITVAGGNVTRARIALGGVGTKPWRSPEAEAALVGQPANAGELPQGGGGRPARRQTAERERDSKSNWPSAASRTLSRWPTA